MIKNEFCVLRTLLWRMFEGAPRKWVNGSKITGYYNFRLYRHDFTLPDTHDKKFNSEVRYDVISLNNHFF